MTFKKIPSPDSIIKMTKKEYKEYKKKSKVCIETGSYFCLSKGDWFLILIENEKEGN